MSNGTYLFLRKRMDKDAIGRGVEVEIQRSVI